MPDITGSLSGIRDKYILDISDDAQLGAGSFGQVFKAVRRDDAAAFAVKLTAKSPDLPTRGPRSAFRMSSTALKSAERKHIERIQEEVDIVRSCRHPHIICLLETYEDSEHIYMVMELCRGGEIIEFIIRASFYREKQVAMIMGQIFQGTEYLHGMHICHRDLKPENILMVTREPIETNTVKIADFGLSCRFETGEELRPRAGTLHYLAPQVVGGRYDRQADLWSLGATLYIILSGRPPFCKSSEKGVLDMIKRGNYAFNGKSWDDVSCDAKDLIRKLLQMDPDQRYTSAQALEHLWVREQAPAAADVWLEEGLASLRKYRPKHKRLVINVPWGYAEEMAAYQAQSHWESAFRSWLRGWIDAQEPSAADIERDAQAAGLCGYLDLYGESLPPTKLLAPMVEKALQQTMVALGMPEPPVRVFARASTGSSVGDTHGVIGDKPSAARSLRIGVTPHEVHGTGPVLALLNLEADCNGMAQLLPRLRLILELGEDMAGEQASSSLEGADKRLDFTARIELDIAKSSPKSVCSQDAPSADASWMLPAAAWTVSEGPRLRRPMPVQPPSPDGEPVHDWESRTDPQRTSVLRWACSACKADNEASRLECAACGSTATRSPTAENFSVAWKRCGSALPAATHLGRRPSVRLPGLEEEEPLWPFDDEVADSQVNVGTASPVGLGAVDAVPLALLAPSEKPDETLASNPKLFEHPDAEPFRSTCHPELPASPRVSPRKPIGMHESRRGSASVLDPRDETQSMHHRGVGQGGVAFGVEKVQFAMASESPGHKPAPPPQHDVDCMRESSRETVPCKPSSSSASNAGGRESTGYRTPSEADDDFGMTDDFDDAPLLPGKIMADSGRAGPGNADRRVVPFDEKQFEMPDDDWHIGRVKAGGYPRPRSASPMVHMPYVLQANVARRHSIHGYFRGKTSQSPGLVRRQLPKVGETLPRSGTSTRKRSPSSPKRLRGPRGPTRGKMPRQPVFEAESPERPPKRSSAQSRQPLVAATSLPPASSLQGTAEEQRSRHSPDRATVKQDAVATPAGIRGPKVMATELSAPHERAAAHGDVDSLPQPGGRTADPMPRTSARPEHGKAVESRVEDTSVGVNGFRLSEVHSGRAQSKAGVLEVHVVTKMHSSKDFRHDHFDPDGFHIGAQHDVPGRTAAMTL